MNREYERLVHSNILNNVTFEFSYRDRYAEQIVEYKLHVLFIERLRLLMMISTIRIWVNLDYYSK